MFFTNLPVSNFQYDSVYLVISYWKNFHVFLGTSEGSILKFNFQVTSVFIIIYHLVFEGVFEVIAVCQDIADSLDNGDKIDANYS